MWNSTYLALFPQALKLTKKKWHVAVQNQKSWKALQKCVDKEDNALNKFQNLVHYVHCIWGFVRDT